MVTTWGNESQADEKCPGCGAVYEASTTRFSERDRGRFSCVKCGELIKQWNDTREWYFRLKEDPDYAERI